MANAATSWGVSLSGRSNFASLGYSAKWAAVSERIMQWTALAEVMPGLSLIVELFTSMRNILLLFMYWQMMQVRYISSSHVKGAFRAVDQRILSLTNHRLCPGVIKMVYNKVRGFLSSRVAPPAAGAAPSRPSCTIM